MLELLYTFYWKIKINKIDLNIDCIRKYNQYLNNKNEFDNINKKQ